jgi:hypothetical protein
VQRATRNRRHAACNCYMQHATDGMQLATDGMQHATATCSIVLRRENRVQPIRLLRLVSAVACCTLHISCGWSHRLNGGSQSAPLSSFESSYLIYMPTVAVTPTIRSTAARLARCSRCAMCAVQRARHVRDRPGKQRASEGKARRAPRTCVRAPTHRRAHARTHAYSTTHPRAHARTDSACTCVLMYRSVSSAGGRSATRRTHSLVSLRAAGASDPTKALRHARVINVGRCSKLPPPPVYGTRSPRPVPPLPHTSTHANSAARQCGSLAVHLSPSPLAAPQCSAVLLLGVAQLCYSITVLNGT